MKRLLILLFPLLLCGCNLLPHKAVSLEQCRIITALGIDSTETGYRLTCFEGTDLSEGAEPKPDALFSVEGDTLTGALSNLRATSGRRPLPEYAGFILLGAPLLETGAEQVLTELYDNPDFPYSVPLLLAEKDAETVLKTISKKTADLTGSIHSMLLSADRLSLPEAPTVSEFYNLLAAPDRDPYLPCLSENDGTVALDGCGIFHGEKMVTVLKDDAARGVGVLLGSARDYPLLLNRDTTVYLRRFRIRHRGDAVELKIYGDTSSKEDPRVLADATIQKIEGWIVEALDAINQAEAKVLKQTTTSAKLLCRIKELNP